MLDSSKREIPAYRCLWHAMVLAERGSVTAQLALLYQKGSYLSSAQRRNIAKELFNAGHMEAYVAMGRYYELRKNKEKAQEYFAEAYYMDVVHVLKEFPISQNILEELLSKPKTTKGISRILSCFMSYCSCQEYEDLRKSLEKEFKGKNAEKIMQKILQFSDLIQCEYNKPLKELSRKIMITTHLRFNFLKTEIPYYNCTWHAIILAERGLVQAQLALLYQDNLSLISYPERVKMATELFEAGYPEAFVALGNVCRNFDKKLALAYYYKAEQVQKNNAATLYEMLETFKEMGLWEKDPKTFSAICQEAADKNYYLAVKEFAFSFASDPWTQKIYLLKAAEIAKKNMKKKPKSSLWIVWENELKQINKALKYL